MSDETTKEPADPYWKCVDRADELLQELGFFRKQAILEKLQQEFSSDLLPGAIEGAVNLALDINDQEDDE